MMDQILKIQAILRQNDRIVYLKNNENKGVGYSQNRGLQSATGDYIVFMESDDLLPQYAIEVLIKNIQVFPAIVGTKKLLASSSDFESLFERRELEISERSTWKAFKGISILNVLMNRVFIVENQVKFYAETDEFTDVSAIMPFILHGGKLPRVLFYLL